MAERLAEYRRKRRFEKTPEPSGGQPAPPSARRKPAVPSGGRKATSPATRPRFVVHEHHARRLHWDLRLERDGVLVSFAIPNGIPEDGRHNRKAVHVEDHPLSYIDFSGTIPQGSYGAGEVMIWDSGTYDCEKWEPRKIVVVFAGERLRGRYSLFQTGKQERDWMIHRMDPPTDPAATEMPDFLEPMLTRLSTLPPEDSGWAFEVKWDGIRALARCEPGRIRLMTRNGNDVSAAYPELRALKGALGSRPAMLDGEIVAFDDQGRPSFQTLQERMHLRGESAVRRLAQRHPVTYLIFDLLWLDGHSLLDLPYAERRRLLQELGLSSGEHWRVPAHHVGDGAAVLAATREQGLEGVVAKRLDSRYCPGRRDAGWLKIKNTMRQEVVIGGFTEGKGGRANRIGALEIGVHDEQGDLRYAGKVGTGFDEQELDRLGGLVAALVRKDSPFVGRQPARGAHFVEPRLVCEVEFGAWTRDGRLRAPSYQGLRDDKDPREVVRERVVPPPAPADSSGPQTRAKRPQTRHGSPQTGGKSAQTRNRSPKTSRGRSRSQTQGSPRHPRGADELAQLIEAGRSLPAGGAEIEVEGRTLKLSNLKKVLYPATGATKFDLIAYYLAAAPALLFHLHDRPLTLKRYPDGVEGEHFYEKQSPRHRPEWVQTVPVWSEHSNREIEYTLCQDLPTLLWLANLADIELHPSLSKAQAIESPTTLAFDLDPGSPANIVTCCEVALLLRDLFAELRLKAAVKTSGSKGLQAYVPLNDPETSYEQTKPFAHAVAGLLERRHPDLIISSMAKAARRGKVLIDWSQNDEHKTTVSVYSLRATARPSVSTPLRWEEVQACRERKDPDILAFAPDQALDRIASDGDLFADVLCAEQRLPDLQGP